MGVVAAKGTKCLKRGDLSRVKCCRETPDREQDCFSRREAFGDLGRSSVEEG